MTRQDQNRLRDRVDGLAEVFGVTEEDEHSLTEAEQDAMYALLEFRYLEWDTWAEQVEGPATDVEYYDQAFFDVALDEIDEEHAAVLGRERQ